MTAIQASSTVCNEPICSTCRAGSSSLTSSSGASLGYRVSMAQLPKMWRRSYCARACQAWQSSGPGTVSTPRSSHGGTKQVLSQAASVLLLFYCRSVFLLLHALFSRHGQHFTPFPTSGVSGGGQSQAHSQAPKVTWCWELLPPSLH